MNREAIYQALFDLSANISWGTDAKPQSFAYRSRRVKLWTDIPVQPALCQAEGEEQVTWRTNLEPNVILGATWLLYSNSAKDPDFVPATETNAMLDAVMAVFFNSTQDMTQDLALNVGDPLSLDSKVHRCWIEGKIGKYQGDLDGQTLITVPIKIMVPS